MDIKDAEGKVHTEPEDKAKAMAKYFFPSLAKADVQNIPGTIYPEEVTTVSKVITQYEVDEKIRNPPSDKDPGQDEIPYGLLKYCRTALSEVLTDLFNLCLSRGYHPKEFKELTTIVLRKPQ